MMAGTSGAPLGGMEPIAASELSAVTGGDFEACVAAGDNSYKAWDQWRRRHDATRGLSGAFSWDGLGWFVGKGGLVRAQAAYEKAEAARVAACR